MSKIINKTELSKKYSGLTVDGGFKLTEHVGTGNIGSVFKAETAKPHVLRACKVIAAECLKDGWEKEVEKVIQIEDDVEGVVRYHGHGTGLDNDSKPFVWILWNYVQGCNLRELALSRPQEIDISFVENIALTILNVLYACEISGIVHGDLHEGNILISDINPNRLINERKIWISDFGYGGSHNNKEPKDDYKQLFSILLRLLQPIDPSSLTPRDRVMHKKLLHFGKEVLELDSTQGLTTSRARTLYLKLFQMQKEAGIESTIGKSDLDGRSPGDYLSAELIGNSIEEWRDLFVPEILAAPKLLSKNVSILTGARGCGKTMAFRRLTLFMDSLLSQPSGVEGSENFIGFYLNSRDLVEAFQSIPKMSQSVNNQLLHYFHLCWLIEICKTFSIKDSERKVSYVWLDSMMSRTYADTYISPIKGTDILYHVLAFLDNDKEKCRSSGLGTKKNSTNWPLSRLDFLDRIHLEATSNIPWLEGRPFYYFLDDYTKPHVQSRLQRVLNGVIFRRSNISFFKVSSEATNSIEYFYQDSKPIQIGHDFELIDLANESLHIKSNVREITLDRIFRRRIDRHPFFHGKNMGLKDVLGSLEMSNNELARQIRSNAENGTKKQIEYHGIEPFVGMWSSDIRTMIKMFSEMINESTATLSPTNLSIPAEIQNRTYRSFGGQFLVFTQVLPDPLTLEEKSSASKKIRDSYGKHLANIAEAFTNVSSYELTKGNLVSNTNKGDLNKTRNPKQAFRIEIVDQFTLPQDLAAYYEGLIRWHIFLQDWRGKSIRAMITPRFYLNRILLPHASLTFSSRDNIALTCEEFCSLLRTPTSFFEYWQKKRSRSKKEKNDQAAMFPTTVIK